ncbi:MAG: acyl carrier protein [Candidatus Margulisiibacteriota bacterium]|jgi:acyl carrier protein
MELKQLIANILKVDVSKINGDSSPDNLESWDSFNSLMMISDIEREFNIVFTTEEVMNVKNYGDIEKLVDKKVYENRN